MFLHALSIWPFNFFKSINVIMSNDSQKNLDFNRQYCFDCTDDFECKFWWYFELFYKRCIVGATIIVEIMWVKDVNTAAVLRSASLRVSEAPRWLIPVSSHLSHDFFVSFYAALFFFIPLTVMSGAIIVINHEIISAPLECIMPFSVCWDWTQGFVLVCIWVDTKTFEVTYML